MYEPLDKFNTHNNVTTMLRHMARGSFIAIYKLAQ